MNANSVLRPLFALAFYLITLLFILVIIVLFAIARGHLTLDGQVGALVIMAMGAFISMAGSAVVHFFKGNPTEGGSSITVSTPPSSSASVTTAPQASK